MVIEPKEGENSLQLRELYELKLKQLARKRAMAAHEPAYSTPDKQQLLHLPHLDSFKQLNDGAARRTMAMAQAQIEIQSATPTREITRDTDYCE